MRAVPQLGRFVHERYLPDVRTYKNSWQTDETVLRIHILPKLGALPLDEIKTDAISGLINGMRTDGYASGTINREDFGIAWGKNFGFKMDTKLAIQIEAFAAE